MTDTDDVDLDDVEPDQLVDQNGLSKLFANRVRAKFIVALFYSEEPLTVPEIADAVGMSRTVTHQAREQLEKFDILETTERDGETAYRLAEDDELVEELRTVATLATERLYD